MNSFALWVGLGAALGLWRIASSAPERQAGAWVNGGLFVFFAGLVGSRAFYVLINWGYFSTHLLETAQVWKGGLSWPGAVAGSALALFYLAAAYRSPNHRRAQHLPLGLISDRLYPLLPPLVISTWLGSWLAGAAYGASLPAGTWWGIALPGECCAAAPRVPVQPAAALLMLAFFWLLEMRVKKSYPPGRLSSIAAGGLLIHLLIVSLLRADPAPVWHGQRIDAWMALVYLALLTGIILVNELIVRLERKSLFSNPERSPS